MRPKQHLLWALVILAAFTLVTASPSRDRKAELRRKNQHTKSSETILGRPNQVECAKGANKRHEDPNDETKFYMCTYSSANRIWMRFSFNCPAETAFDTRSQKCARRETIESSKNPPVISHKPSHQFVLNKKLPTTTNNVHFANITTITRDRFPIRKNNPAIVVTTRPSLSQRIRNQVKINVNYSTLRTRATTTRYSVTAPTTRMTTPAPTTTTTPITTKEPPTTTTPEPMVIPSEIKSNLTGETTSPTKHISAIRSVASKIAYLASKIETLLTSIESSLTSKYCDEDATANSNNAFITQTPPVSFIDQFIKGPTGTSSNEEDESPSKELSAEDLSVDNSKENPQPSIQLTTPSEDSSEDSSAWTVFLNQVKPNLPNENSHPSTPQKSVETSDTDNLSDSQETPLKIENVLENFFKTTNVTAQSQFQVTSSETSQDKLLSDFMLGPVPEATLDNSEEQPEITEVATKTKGSHRRPRLVLQKPPIPSIKT
ncbi:unnamed protein product [Allacma fusca]|uniref:Chitin-binding type-2 domain-containing protein n=1 Tax=Allacma fusca TaxID=39272 RepID=A0A8J2PAQ6_9HEXA|nr:unnamed protein product [Allacma fusca]